MLISLIGYRGTGKTTVGRLLAERLGWVSIDTDAEVENLAGRSIGQIFATDGEATFRDLESAVVAQLCRRHKVVLSLGGGAILRAENRQAISVAGPVVWLTASPETLWSRITGDPRSTDQRPQLTQLGGLREIEEVLAARTEIYRGCADLELSTEEQQPRELVEAIMESLGLRPEVGGSREDR